MHTVLAALTVADKFDCFPQSRQCVDWLVVNLNTLDL